MFNKLYINSIKPAYIHQYTYDFLAKSVVLIIEVTL